MRRHLSLRVLSGIEPVYYFNRVTMRKLIFILMGFLSLQSIGFQALAARFPNSVEKKIIFRGEKAMEIALLLGFEKDRESERVYLLGEQDIWAVALRESPQDPAKVADRNRFNRIHYTPKPMPCLIMEGNWLDSHTGSSPAAPRYLFNSTVIFENSSYLEWVRLLNHLLAMGRKPRPEGSYWEIVFKEEISEKGSPIFSITVYHPRDKDVPLDRKGYFILIRANDSK